MPTKQAKSSQKKSASTPKKTEKAKSKPAKKSNPAKTQIIIHYDCGFANMLFIRGEGVSSLSWDKGILLKNISSNRWLWESDRPFSTMQFKILINDTCYEQGPNHAIAFGQKIDISPSF